MERKGYVWEVSWRLNKDGNILTPSSSGYSSSSFSSCRAAQPGALRAQPQLGPGSHSFELQPLTPNSDHQPTRTSCGTRLYNCLMSTCFSERRICTQFNPPTVKVIPWYLRPDAHVIYTGAFLIWQLGRVGGQYVTIARLEFELAVQHVNPNAARTPGLSEPGINSNEGVLHIPKGSSAGASPSNCLMSYPGQALGGLIPL